MTITHHSAHLDTTFAHDTNTIPRGPNGSTSDSPSLDTSLLPLHHGAKQSENQALPIYRREHLSSTAFVEGWGNYGSFLARDMGLLDDLWVQWPAPVDGVMTAPETPGHGLKIKTEIMRDCVVG